MNTSNFAFNICMLLALGLFGQAAIAGQGLCTSGETTFFSCETRQKKVIALCGNTAENVQYRFGTPARVELRYPNEATKGAAAFGYAYYIRYMTSRTEVTFGNRDASYTVFDYREESEKRNAGVQVSRDDAKDVILVCVGPIHSRLGELQDVVPCDVDNALNMGSCPAR